MKIILTILSICIFALAPIDASAADGDAQKEQVASLIGTLGYGGAIHNFKNYVLRGDDKYRIASQNMFQKANQILADLGKGSSLTSDQRAALAAITETANAYQKHLPTIGQMRKQGKSVEEIDEAVSVDDSAAIKAIAALRSPHTWSNIDELDFHIGFGSGIHNFKNFILRADEKYRAQSALRLSNVLLIIARYRASGDLTGTQVEALNKVESVVRAYEEALPKVQDLIGEGRTAQQIDEVVKVDDTPALQGLATLRK